MCQNMRVLLVSTLLWFCSSAYAELFKPTEPLVVNAWSGGGESGFVYPELGDGAYGMDAVKSKRYLGIALSGGSARAAALALGWMRALHSMQITQKAGYLATNSGASWFSTVFSFQKELPVDKFLGPYIAPEQLSLKALDNTDDGTSGGFATVLSKAGVVFSSITEALSAVFSDGAGKQSAADGAISAWTAAIGKAFLGPFQLADANSTYTAAGTTGKVHEGLNKLPIKVYTYDNDGGARPFPLIMGAVRTENSDQPFHPFEFTPLYGGISARFMDSKPALGGGYVDTLGLNSLPPQAKPELSPAAAAGKEPFKVQVQSAGVMPLVTAVSISSGIFGVFSAPGMPITEDATGAESLEYWNQINFAGGKMAFVDGGAVDNTAVTMLLRRRVSHIVACVAAKTAINNTSSEQWAAEMEEVAGLFAAVPSTKSKINRTPVDRFNKMLQVFPKDDFNRLYEGVKKSFESGGPVYHMATYKVMDNPYQAIQGGWEVEVLWVINQQQKKWEETLPAETKQVLAASRKLSGWQDDLLSQFFGDILKLPVGRQDLQTFPYTGTEDANLTPALTGLLTQQASWQMMQLKQQLDQLVKHAASSSYMTVASRLGLLLPVLLAVGLLL